MIALRKQEIRQLLAGINLDSTWGRRDYLLILFLYHTGLRVGELCQVTVQLAAVNGKPREEIFIPWAITKTRKSRNIPLNPVAQKCVAKLLEFNKSRGFSTAAVAPLFPWKNHRSVPPREVQRMIQKLREKVNMTAKVTPHSLRHSFASELSRNGVPVPTISALLGHQRMKSTMIYTHSTEQDKRAGVDSLVSKPKN